MRRSTGGASSPDAQLRGIPDEHLLDFLAAARRGLATATAGQRPGFEGALATLELEAARRALDQASPHERPPLVQVLRKLCRIPADTPGGEWPRLLAELRLPGLWAVYLYAQDELEAEERLPALVHVAYAVDRILFGEKAARLRHLKNVELPTSGAERLAKLNAALEATFGGIFDAMAAEEETED